MLLVWEQSFFLVWLCLLRSNSAFCSERKREWLSMMKPSLIPLRFVASYFYHVMNSLILLMIRSNHCHHSYYKNPVFHYLSNQSFLFLHIQELLSGNSDMARCEWGSTMRLRSDHHHCLYASYEMPVPWDMQLLYCWFEQSRRWSGNYWLLNTAYCDCLKYLLWWQEQYKGF